MSKFFPALFAALLSLFVAFGVQAQSKVRLEVCTAMAKAYGGNWDSGSNSARKGAYAQVLALLTADEKKHVNLTFIARGEEAWNKGMEPYTVFRQYEQAFAPLEQACNAQGDSPHALYKRAEQAKDKERQARIRQEEAELSNKK